MPERVINFMSGRNVLYKIIGAKPSIVGKWFNAHYLWYILLTIISLQSSAQNIVKAEYFFDTDPGVGNGTAITLTPGPSVTFTASISTASLSAGFHQLAIRVKETGGLWSKFENRGFYISTVTTDVPNITSAEYFFDTDPGEGNATSLSIPGGATSNFTVSIPTASLSAGFHFLAIRTKATDGRWGTFEGRGFYISSATTNVSNLTAAEYFFDIDPGEGNGLPLSIPSGATSNFTVSIPTNGLQTGFHFLAIRTKATDGRWGIFESRGFYVTSSTTDVSDITSAEYFFDTDPGKGNATPLSIPSGATSNFSVSLPTTGLIPGFHFLTIRTKGSSGQWGLFESRGFYISQSAVNSADIVAAEYFFDDVDPGEGNAKPLSITTPGITVNQLFDISLNGVASGTRTLNFRVKDANGFWSETQRAPFTVLTCTPPTAPTATDASRCNSGTVVLNATSGVSGSQVYRWYADASTTTVSFTGAAFTTPSLNTTTSFFLSVFDPVTLCESARTSVTATIVNTSPPILNVTGSVTICEGNSITISAPVGFNSYLWSNGETTRQIQVATAGDYSVVGSNGACQSLSSSVATIAVAARPTKPAVSVTGTLLCEGQSIAMKGPDGFASYVWSNGASTQQISVTQAGSYSLAVRDANGCSSLPSDLTIINSVPVKPTIFVLGNTILCEGQSVTLIGPTGLSYSWSDGKTSQLNTISTAGSFTLKVKDSNGCESVSSDQVDVAVNTIPSKPIIIASGNTIFCNGQSIILKGPDGFTYLWSTGNSAQQISVAQTGSYSLIVRDQNNCTSVSSDPMVVTVQSCGSGTGITNAPPTIDSKSLAGLIEGKVVLDLTKIISDPDNNIDFSSLRVINQLTSRGAPASISSSYELTVNYTGLPFTGTDRITLEVCDLAGACAQKVFDIEVVGEVVIYNGLTPNGDGINDVMKIQYLDVVDGASQNKVSIYNRWGDVVFEIINYDNVSRVFTGLSNQGKELPPGTYFYKVEFSKGSSREGFITLKR